jgi:hypothetical protein
MAEDLRAAAPPDRERINLDKPLEVKWWAVSFGVSESELRRATDDVGTSVAKVAARLRKKRP